MVAVVQRQVQAQEPALRRPQAARRAQALLPLVQVQVQEPVRGQEPVQARVLEPRVRAQALEPVPQGPGHTQCQRREVLRLCCE